jgi:hypothetical protein
MGRLDIAIGAAAGLHEVNSTNQTTADMNKSSFIVN